MKLTRRQLKRIISETIKMPVARPEDWRQTGTGPEAIMFKGSQPETIDPGDNMEDQSDFLNRVHGKPASVVDHDGFLAMKGAKEVRDSEARSLANSFVRVDMAAAESAEMKLASLLNPAFNLVVDMSSFNEYVTQRKPDPQGRPILVSMGSDGQKVVFKYRDQPKYYVYEMLPAARFDPDGSMGMKESRLRKLMNREINRMLLSENQSDLLMGMAQASGDPSMMAMVTALRMLPTSEGDPSVPNPIQYGKTLEDAKAWALERTVDRAVVGTTQKQQGGVVHFVKGFPGTNEKIYVVHRDGEGLSGLNNMSDIPTGENASIFYEKTKAEMQAHADKMIADIQQNQDIADNEAAMDKFKADYY